MQNAESNLDVKAASGSPPRDFTFVLIPGFSLLALSCAIDVLRAANADAGHPVYRWFLASADNDSVNSSSGLPLPTHPITQLEHDVLTDRSVVAVCGGDGSHNYHSASLTRWLRQLATRDVMIGSLSDAAFVLADCGLFYNHLSTIHWKCLDAYRTRFPDLECRASILEIDRRRFSCAGGTASLDLFLHFVHEDFGAEEVANITDNYFHDAVRDSSISQHMAQAYRYANRNKALAQALHMMAQNLDQPLSITSIARQVGTTHRSLDRTFNKHLGLSPGKYFRQLRLAKAAALLQQTGLPVSEIAVSCGFNTASHLGTHFRKSYELTPLQYRQQSSTEHSEANSAG